jgi:type I restriction enzyme S subunit
VRSFPIAFPSATEQNNIGIALSDVDSLLERLERLIAKKRDLKQAAMQQLLTGKTRLPGFTGEWQPKTLGELGAIYGGLSGKTKEDFGDGEGLFVTFMNVMSNVRINCESFERVRILPAESQNRVQKGDLLLNGSSETPEEVALCSVVDKDVPDLFLNSFCFGFRFYDETQADALFIALYLRSREGREIIKLLAQGSTRYNLSKPALLKSIMRLPQPKEQIAIAAVLTDMDTELAALEQRLAKTRDLKQAMMQELLTGKTRLVTLEAIHA